MAEPGGYDAAPALVAAFALAGLSQTWRLASNGVVSGLVADAALIFAAAVALVAVVRWAASDLRLIGRAAELGDPRWSLAPLVALIATERLADLSPAVGRPLLTAIATLAVLFSATSAAGWLRSRDAVRPEHLLPTATAGFTVSLALHGPAAYAAFAAGTLGWLLVAGALTRRGLMWPYPSVITLSPPSLGGLAWLALRDGRVDAIAVAFGIASAATLIRLRVRAGGFAWTAIFPATAAARLLVGLSGTGPAPWIALAAAAGLSAAAMSELVGSLRTDPGDPSRAYE